MSSGDRVSIPLLGKLIPGGVKPGTIFTVEFDPDSQWFAVAETITAEVLKKGGNIAVHAFARPPADVETNLSSLGVNTETAFKEGRLQIDDYYTASLSGGRIEPFSPGGTVQDTPKGSVWLSIRIQDQSIEILKYSKNPQESQEHAMTTWPPGTLIVGDSASVLLRFNEEKSLADFVESRFYPELRKLRRIMLWPFVRGLHTEWFYKRMESACEGIIDVRVMEQETKSKNFLRIRNLRGRSHDSAWHEIEIKPNGEAALTS